MLQAFVLACPSFLSCVQQTNESVFLENSTNAFALQHFTSKTGILLGSNKRNCVLQYAYHFADVKKKVYFFSIECRQLEFGHSCNPQVKKLILRILFHILNIENQSLTFFEDRNPFQDHMMKIKNVRNTILKVLKSVRTHPEELLVVEIGFFAFLKARMHFRTI